MQSTGNTENHFSFGVIQEMLEGMLVVNTDPPYIGFYPKLGAETGNTAQSGVWRYCTHEQIKDLLLDLHVISVTDRWPLRECILRLPITCSRAHLVTHGLVRQLKDIAVAQPMRRVS